MKIIASGDEDDDVKVTYVMLGKVRAARCGVEVNIENMVKGIYLAGLGIPNFHCLLIRKQLRLASAGKYSK